MTDHKEGDPSMYKKIKRILALAAVIIIGCLYALTLLLALSPGDGADELLMLSIVATVVLPVLLYIYLWLFRLFKGDDTDDRQEQP